MQFGVRTVIPTPEKTTQAKESKTPRDNREIVWKHLRKFVANGWLRAFPPSSAWILSQWRLRVSSIHFVDKTKYNKERLVTDLGNAGGEGEGQDANTLSPDLGCANVQADYIDDVADAICKDMKAKGLDSEELAAIKADIKAAFMQVPIHLWDVGTLCMSFEGWTFVFVRTPFGWKWATHTFSVFTAALKNKTSELLSDRLETPGSSGSVASHDTQVQSCLWS